MEFKTDREFKAYNKGLEKSHTTSPNTLRLFKNMDDKFDKIDKKVSDLHLSVTEGFGSIKLEIINEINAMKKDISSECEKKFAPLWAANAIKFVLGAAVLTLTASFMTLILK